MSQSHSERQISVHGSGAVDVLLTSQFTKDGKLKLRKHVMLTEKDEKGSSAEFKEATTISSLGFRQRVEKTWKLNW
ncbi:CLUMA_CG010243, isoform A [Clunio marinus]|uniref:CLUMA_CG010243, isoform A n=1 Tax=Clunio marinus TaxID=568069 RepID=A0A1J1I8Y3_9DIPT|nr:CLUMA_CG010243, isoform A [Clunio marinus]